MDIIKQIISLKDYINFHSTQLLPDLNPTISVMKVEISILKYKASGKLIN